MAQAATIRSKYLISPHVLMFATLQIVLALHLFTILYLLQWHIPRTYEDNLTNQPHRRTALCTVRTVSNIAAFSTHFPTPTTRGGTKGDANAHLSWPN